MGAGYSEEEEFLEKALVASGIGMSKSIDVINGLRDEIFGDNGPSFVTKSNTIAKGFGNRCQLIMNEAVKVFKSTVPHPKTPTQQKIYNKILSLLTKQITSNLFVLYLKQLDTLSQLCLTRFKIAVKSGSGSEYDAALEATDYYTKTSATLLLKSDYTNNWKEESTNVKSRLKSQIQDLTSSNKKLQTQINKDKLQQTNVLQYLQTQHQQIQQLSQQLYGSQTPWNAALAYRLPNTNLNLQGQHQSGRTTVVLSCVPDEYAPMLGANGFTNGVGPGNLGVSLNLSL